MNRVDASTTYASHLDNLRIRVESFLRYPVPYPIKVHQTGSIPSIQFGGPSFLFFGICKLLSITKNVQRYPTPELAIPEFTITEFTITEFTITEFTITERLLL